MAPLTQTFTRSSSTSTIKGGDSGEESQTPIAPQPPTIPSASSDGISMLLHYHVPFNLTGPTANFLRPGRCLGIPRLPACRTREAWYPDSHPSRGQGFLSPSSLSADFQLAFPGVSATQFLLFPFHAFHPLHKPQPSAVDKFGNQCSPDYPWPLFDQIPSLRSPGFREESSLRRRCVGITRKSSLGW